MTRRAWVRLDNASNIFLAARSDTDPKVFRISAEMDHAVDRQLLQKAVDATYERYRLYHAVLRSGVFWYYLQESDVRPLVTAEEQPTCAPIYQADRRRLLFRVMHHHQRIILEVFHALSDGTGALWFLSDLVTAYLRRRQAGQNRRFDDTREAIDPGAARGLVDAGTNPDGDAEVTAHGLIADSFAHYFRRPRRPRVLASESAFHRAAVPALTGGDVRSPPTRPREMGRAHRPSLRRVYRVRGTRTSDNRTRAVELTAPAQSVLALARAEGVTLTMYLTALFVQAVRSSAGDLGKNATLAASVPVNLRQFFPSRSPRNFFATIRVEHTFGAGPDDLGAICRHLDSQFRPKATPEALETKLQKLVRFERMPALRIVPRPLKDVILKLINWRSNRGLSIAVSNLGRVTLPESAQPHVRRLLFHVSAVRPQLCAISHAGLLTITFTSPFTETNHIKEFARLLTSRDIEVTIAAARVTEAELADRGS